MQEDPTNARYQQQLNDENALLLSILDGTSSETGEAFFRLLVRELARVLKTYGALVADYDAAASQLRPRAYWLGDQWVEPGPYDIAGTPCEGVIREGQLFQIPDRVIEHHPQNTFLRDYDVNAHRKRHLFSSIHSSCLPRHPPVIGLKPPSPPVHLATRVRAADPALLAR